MDDPDLVRRGQAASGVHEYALYLGPAPRLRAQPRVEGLAPHELHRDEDLLAVPADIEHAHDVGVLEAGQRLCLPDHARAGDLGIFTETLGVQDLERDRAAELRVGGLVDDPHRAAAEAGAAAGSGPRGPAPRRRTCGPAARTGAAACRAPNPPPPQRDSAWRPGQRLTRRCTSPRDPPRRPARATARRAELRAAE